MKQQTFADRCRRIVIAAVVALACCAALAAAEPAGQTARDAAVQTGETVKPFQLDLRKYDFSQAPKVKPWKVVPLPSGYYGPYVVAADLDGDGEIELVTGRHAGTDQEMVCGATVKLDGTVLWTWGAENEGTQGHGCDAGLQVHDWDGDGKPEVFVAQAKEILVLAGKDGRVLRRLPLPTDWSDSASRFQRVDCIAFARFTNAARPTDVIIKDRYPGDNGSRIWAYSPDWKLLWTITKPGDRPTCHYPRPMDLDGDGYDEFFPGFALADRTGALKWEMRDLQGFAKGHLDCAQLVRAAKDPAEQRIAVTTCTGKSMALLDGHGKVLWEKTGGKHYEALDVGRLRSDVPGRQIVVDLDKKPYTGTLEVYSEAGELLGTYWTEYSRFHRVLDWDGDGLDEIVLARTPAVVDGHGKLVAFLDGVDASTMREGALVFTGNLTGKGFADVALIAGDKVYIFQNPSPGKPANPLPLCGEFNFTHY
jgi:hypothetical protein